LVATENFILKLMRKVLCGLIAILFLSCSSYKFDFVPTTESAHSVLNITLEKRGIITQGQLFLAFTKGFENELIIIKQKNDTILNSSISTDGKKIADALKINKNSPIEIHFKKSSQN